MEDITEARAVLNRLKLGTNATSDSELARKLGVSQQAIYNARNTNKLPDAWIRKSANNFNLSTDWLYFGVGEVQRASGNFSNKKIEHAPPNSAQLPAQIVEQNPWERTPYQDVPVLALANCGTTNWYAPDIMALRVRLPIDYPYTPNLFAVLAMGSSMVPEGIRQGFIVFCDPNVKPEPSDVVYIEKKDETASIKKFLKQDGKIHLQGWKPPDANGNQAPYFEELNNDDVKRIVCIVVVKRKS